MDIDESLDLEAMVDTYTITGILYELSEICTGKAEHLRTTWQDELAAQAWDRAARQFERLSREVWP
jgi:hypothetical protein